MSRRLFSAAPGAVIFVAMLLLVPALHVSAAENAPAAPGDHEEMLQFGGMARSFIVHVPSGFDPHRKTPVVIMLHGRGGSGARVENQTGWDALADRENFLAVFPDATPQSPDQPPNFRTNPRQWNWSSGNGGGAGKQGDDVGFIAALIDLLESSYGADPARVYVTGFSNGGSISWVLGAELTSRIAAIAPVSGELWSKPLKLTGAMPTLFIIGTADPLNPLAGGSATSPWGNAQNHAPVEDTLSGWRDALGCTGEPRTVRDSGGLHDVLWNKCAHGEFEYVTVEGQGHVWPGAQVALPHIFGNSINLLDATSTIWTFFKAHPKHE
ncbi:MAG: PHB depolymerase family esterase [Candidatus Binatus sp.]